MTPGPYRVALAINPSSGQGRGQRAGAAAAARLEGAGCTADVLIGKDAADLSGQLQHLLGIPAHFPEHPRPDALVVTGGDGMVQLGVSALAAAGWPLPLGIIPAGTGNDVARALDLPVGDWEGAADAILAGLSDPAARRRIDAVRCTPAGGSPGGASPGGDSAAGGSAAGEPGAAWWFTGVLGAGFDAIVNERANHWSWPKGRARYVLAMLRELPVFTPRAYRLTLDGQEWRTPAMLVAVANSPSYGGGMRVCPDARLDDGLLDVLVVRPLSRPAFLGIFPRVYSGTHVRDPRVEIRRAATVRIEAPGIVGYADGERFGPLPLLCEVVPAALEVLTGRSPGRTG